MRARSVSRICANRPCKRKPYWSGCSTKVAQVQRSLDENQALQLRDANEHLVLIALKAQEDMDTVRGDLDAVKQTSLRDGLTGLPNRTLMLDRIETAIANARRRGGQVAVLFVDLDDFKQINDTLGHAAGDRMLIAVAHCLSGALRDSDTVSRHGGDEFVVMLAEVGAPADAAQVAGKIQQALSASAPPGELTLCAASIGIALYPEDGDCAADLIDRADEAMYRVKQRGGRACAFYAGPRAD